MARVNAVIKSKTPLVDILFQKWSRVRHFQMFGSYGLRLLSVEDDCRVR